MTIEIAGASLLIGVIVGVLWARFAPDVYGQVLENGVGQGAFDGRLRFGQDVTFGALAGVAGLLLALVFTARYRRRPVSALILLVVLGLGGSWVAWRVGVQLGPPPIGEGVAEDVGDRIAMPLDVNARSVLLAWSLVSAISALMLAALRDDRARWGSK
jgi:hypothetical protein